MDFLLIPLVVASHPELLSHPTLFLLTAISCGVWVGAFWIAKLTWSHVTQAFEPPPQPRKKTVQELAEEEAWYRADARRLEAMNEHLMHKAHADDTQDFIKKRKPARS